MLKKLLPVLLALGGLAAGAGAGVMLKPAGEAEAAACAEAGGEGEAEACAEAAPLPTQAAGAVDSVPLDKPFVVPVFAQERVAAMVVVSLTIDVPKGFEGRVTMLQPRLRDGLLGVMFRHANSGGFDGSFTAGQKMADLKAALLVAAREVLAGVPVHEVLVTDIVRQDV